MATTTPNFGWPVPTSTDLVKDGATAIEALGDGIDTSMVDLKGGTTGQLLAKASGTDMDFTWTSPNPGDITAVTAGTGISGGGTSGDVTITNSMATAIDAKGDLVAGTGADAFARLAVGNNGEVLVADSTASTGLKWSKFPGIVGCAVYSSAQAIANNTDVNFNFDSERLDTNGFHSTSTNTSRITIPTGLAGWYVINAKFRWDKNATGIRLLKIKKNGSEINAAPEQLGSSTVFMGNELNIIDYLVAGDYIEFGAFQTSGGALNAYLDSVNGQFSVIMVGV